MKKHLTLFVFIFIAGHFFSQSLNYAWANGFGYLGDDLGLSIQVDASGNVYMIGAYGGTVDFDPGPGTALLTSSIGGAGFIAKYDNSGNYIWAKSLVGVGGQHLILDASGNIYMCGYFNYTCDFDPGPGTATLVAGRMFLAKYDNAGNYIWAEAIGGNSPNSSALQLDAAGNIYMAGTYSGTADFDPGAGVGNLSSNGGNDVFFAKYDNAGNYIWAKNIGSGFNDNVGDMQLDAAGNLYLTGDFTQAADFDPGPATINLTSVAQSKDVFFAKYNSTGAYVWAKQIGSPTNDSGTSLKLDQAGNIYLTGYYSGAADFDAGPGTFNMVAEGINDVFITKYDNAGNYSWVKNIGGSGADCKSLLLQLDGAGNIFLGGNFKGTADFNAGAGTNNLVSGPNIYDDFFLARYDNSGNYSWAYNFDGVSVYQGVSFVLDGSNAIYATGGFHYTAEFNPGPNSNTLTSSGGADIFIAKYQDVPLGLKEFGKNLPLKIYPNPAAEMLNVEWEMINEEAAKNNWRIEIVNALGQVVNKEEVLLKSKTTQIDVKDLPNGVYFLNLKGVNSQTISKRFVIAK